MNEIRNERGETKTDTTEIQKKKERIICTDIYQEIGQPRRNGQISRTCTLLRQSQEETDNLNRPITRCEIESVVTETP